jgi:hypothetical protein
MGSVVVTKDIVVFEILAERNFEPTLLTDFEDVLLLSMHVHSS